MFSGPSVAPTHSETPKPETFKIYDKNFDMKGKQQSQGFLKPPFDQQKSTPNQ